MFGTLKPEGCSLGCAGRRAHGRFYCGLCKSLGDGYGTVSRALVSYDAVLVALLVDALVDEPAAPARCRCPLLPVVHRATVSVESSAMRFAAAVQILLADQWLADRAMEGGRVAGVARPLLGGRVAAAERELEALGIDASPLRGVEMRQARSEGSRAVEEAAGPTREALGWLFEQIACLEGATPEAGRAAPELRRLGEALGSAIYLVDALDDLEKDYVGGAFNPCIRDGRIEPVRVEQCAHALEQSLATIAEALAALPLRRHRDVIVNILCDGLTRQATDARARARSTADEQARARLSAYLALPWPARALRRALLLVTFVLAWLGSLTPVFAQERRRPSLPPTLRKFDARSRDSGPRDAGPSASDAGPDAGGSPGAGGDPGTSKSDAGVAEDVDDDDGDGDGKTAGSGSAPGPGSGSGGGGCTLCDDCFKLCGCGGQNCCDECCKCCK